MEGNLLLWILYPLFVLDSAFADLRIANLGLAYFLYFGLIAALLIVETRLYFIVENKEKTRLSKLTINLLQFFILLAVFFLLAMYVKVLP